jgi:hypothetical protein
VHVRHLVPLSQWRIEVLHLLIQQGNSWFDQTRAALQYMVQPSEKLRDVSRHPPDTWPDLESGVGQAAIWRSRGLDLEAVVQDVFNIRRPLQKYHGGQLEMIHGQQHLIWEHSKLAAALSKMAGDRVCRRVMTSVKSAWKCLSSVNREVHQAHPAVDVVMGYIRAFLHEVDLL